MWINPNEKFLIETLQELKDKSDNSDKLITQFEKITIN